MKKLIRAALVLLLLFVLLEFDYLVTQVLFFLAPPAAVDETAASLDPDTLFIPSLKIRAPIVEPGAATEEAFQRALEFGVAHFPGTAKVGDPGNAYLFGHSSDFLWKRGDYKAVFAVLPKINMGDKIIAANSQGRKFVYKAVRTEVISPDDVKYLEQGDLTKKIMTLQTSYPVGTALRRFIVISELE